ncbi:Serine/threonine protein kinase [Giardia duodenalis]|uniref:non-specific serine/threonine protein kinase n=1 Tax=Giardia intestinalis TaxID=5741 RepID=V6TP28_GIAIN|nr:Serine/threonine protein kinase [Giardia intestinalis]
MPYHLRPCCPPLSVPASSSCYLPVRRCSSSLGVCLGQRPGSECYRRAAVSGQNCECLILEWLALRALQLLGRRLQEPVDIIASCLSRAVMQCPRIAECTNVPLQPEARPASPPIPRAIGQGINCMIDKDPHARDPPLKRLGVPVFDLAELREREGGVLGRGAFGVVRSIEGYPGLAVKEVRVDGLGASALRSLRFELTTLTTLTHPGILRYHQIIEDENGDLIYIVMDRHDASLETLIMRHRRRKEPVSAETILALAAQITGALAYLHGIHGVDARGDPYQGIVHRDLKPANILVSEDRKRVVLADFGPYKNALRSGNTIIEILVYMAPETLIYNSTTPASDIWSLGVIVYELATLKKPNFLEGKEPKDVFINGWRPDLSAIEDVSIRSILERIFVLDPVKRPTARELAELLRVSDASVVRMRLRAMMLEETLNKANARIASLEKELQTKSSDICALKNTITTQTAEIDSLRKDLETKFDQIDAQSSEIDALKGQCKEHLTTTKALESRIALLIAKSNLQSELLLLPRLVRAAHTNSTETVQMLVEGGDGVGKRDEQGMTALMHAAQQGHVEPARLLVEEEQGLQDRNGWTALMHAAHNNHFEVVEILAAHECGNRDINGRTALMIAAERGHTEIVAALAQHEKGLTDSSGNTALMLAADNARTEAVRQLVEHEKGMKDSQNHSALLGSQEWAHRSRQDRHSSR